VPGSLLTLPALCFLVQHSTAKVDSTPKRLVFDLGINPDLYTYQKLQRGSMGQMLSSALAHGGATPDDISFIILSHCHWDHIGDTHPFTKNTFVVGHDTKTPFVSGGYPTDRTSHPPRPTKIGHLSALSLTRLTFLENFFWRWKFVYRR
jgi:glyoxylase-like metal-dependent hydrolase (beta-lactamase superfamily II)